MFCNDMTKINSNLLVLSCYKGSKEDIYVRCKIHDYTFKTKPNYLKSGRGCKFCANEMRSLKRRKSVEKALCDFNKVHDNKYSYPNIDKEYKNNRSIITIICPIHGEFQQKALLHLRGEGCSECSHRSKAYTTEEWISKAKCVHNNKYTYDKTVYENEYNDVIITCPIHGDFTQVPKDHLQGCGCQRCSESSLERNIRGLLEKYNIEYTPQYKGNTSNNKSVDFFLPKYNLAIECQGEQHFKPIKYFGGELKFNQIVKRDICKFEEVSNCGNEIMYVTNKAFMSYSNDNKFNGIYENRLFCIEDIKNDDKILINKINFNNL